MTRKPWHTPEVRDVTPDQLWLALSSADPGDGGQEATGHGYARVPLRLPGFATDDDDQETDTERRRRWETGCDDG